jgi:hypothetical protein
VAQLIEPDWGAKGGVESPLERGDELDIDGREAIRSPWKEVQEALQPAGGFGRGDQPPRFRPKAEKGMGPPIIVDPNPNLPLG